MDRNEVIIQIKAALYRRSRKHWSVTGGRGTAWGWIQITSLPARQTWGHRLKADASPAHSPEDYEEYDTGQRGGYMSPADRAELGVLLGLHGPCHCQGVNIAASTEHYREYLERAEGRQPAKIAQAYWD